MAKIEQKTTTTTPVTPPITNKKNTKYWWWLAAIVALTAAVFYNSLFNDFTNWDDPVYVEGNQYIKKFNAQNLAYIFKHDIAANYHPFTMLTLMANYLQGGLNPFPYHLWNYVLHLLNVLGCFWFLYHLSNRRLFVALFGALFFGIHPMHVESVAWISERKDVLYTLFFFPALTYYIFYSKKEGNDTKSYILALLLYIAALFSKPSAVVFPLLAFCIDFLNRRPFSLKMLWEKIPLFALSLIFGLLTVMAQKDTAIDDLTRYTFIQKLMFASYGFVMYIVKMFVPYSLSPYYIYPVLDKNTGMPLNFAIMPLFVIALVGGAVWLWYKKNNRIPLFALAFYFFNVVLVLQFLTLGSTVMSERYTYVAYTSLLFAVGMGIDYLIKNEAYKSFKNIALALCLVATVAFSYISVQRNKIWKNTETMWTDVIKQYGEVSQVHGAFSSRANYYSEKKEYDRALRDFNKSIELNSNYADAFMNRGNVYRNLNKHREAITDYNKAMAIKNNYDLIYVNRGNAYFNLGIDDSALLDYNKAIEVEPNNDKAFGNRAAIFTRQKQYDKALQDFDKALQINPDYPDAYLNMGVLNSMQGKFDKDEDYYTKYLSFKNIPANPQVYNWRGLSRYHQKKYNEALADYNKALELNSGSGEYYVNRAQTLIELGNKAQAQQDLADAQKLGWQIDPALLQKAK